MALHSFLCIAMYKVVKQTAFGSVVMLQTRQLCKTFSLPSGMPEQAPLEHFVLTT